MKALLLAAVLLAVPVSADALTFPVSVEVIVFLEGTVTLPLEVEGESAGGGIEIAGAGGEIEIAEAGFLTGTGLASIGRITSLAGEAVEFDGQVVEFDATGPGGVSASGVSGFADEGGLLVGFIALILRTPDFVFFGSHEFRPGGANVDIDPVSRTAVFGGSLTLIPGGDAVAFFNFGSEFSEDFLEFTGQASFIGVAAAIPEASVISLMLVSWLLLSTTAVFRRAHSRSN